MEIVGEKSNKREQYSVYLNREVMVALRKYCLDKGMKVSNILEEIILRKVTEK